MTKHVGAGQSETLFRDKGFNFHRGHFYPCLLPSPKGTYDPDVSLICRHGVIIAAGNYSIRSHS